MNSRSSATSELTKALVDGATLLDSSKNTAILPNAKSVLQTRLSQYFSRLEEQEPLWASWNLNELQLKCAQEALSVVERVQRILDLGGNDVTGAETSNLEGPVIGTRDLAELRNLLSMVVKWGVNPLLSHMYSVWSSRGSSVEGSGIVDLTSTPEYHAKLSDLSSRLFRLIFPTGIQSQLPQTLITTSILNRHIVDLLGPALALGWLPKSITNQYMPILREVRPLTLRLLSILPPSQNITALGNIMASPTRPPPHVRKLCASLMTRQLIRPGGVMGLCEAIFGDGEISEDNVSLEKFEHITLVIKTVPSTMSPQEYFQVIIPRLMDLLSDKLPTSYSRAAAFTISRLLAPTDTPSHQAVISIHISELLHSPFLWQHKNDAKLSSPDAITSEDPNRATASRALSNIIMLMSNTDPSPMFITNLLSPIVPELYSLLYHMDRSKLSDPILKESLRSILVTWGKICSAPEGVDVVWRVVDGEGGESHWQVDADGQILKLHMSEEESPPLLLPNQKPDDTGVLGINLFDQYPDPTHFVDFLKTIGREDIVSNIFVKLLEEYRVLRPQPGGDNLRSSVFRYLQLIMQVQERMYDGTRSIMLQKPTHMLNFVKHVLESSTAALPAKDPSRDSKLASLRPLGSANLNEDDSDDDIPDSEIRGTDDEILEIALNLLLSILEGDTEVDEEVTLVLNDIFSFLEPFTWSESSSLQPLARESRMVITARLAYDSAQTRQSSNKRRGTHETYQKALKLLQDPILPVRAHGLLLLRTLLTSLTDQESGDERIVAALMPAILSIFMQSVQDDDSYIFLNAVQGLAAMVDKFGQDVLKILIQEYSDGLAGLAMTVLTQQHIDTKIRIGEALHLVIKKCGDALGLYVDTLVPPLFNIVRSHGVPVMLRISSLSLLAECVNTHALALLPYSQDLARGMLDLLQTESLQVKAEAPSTMTNSSDGDHPVTSDSKLSLLRRAALHLLAQLIRKTVHETFSSIFSSELVHSIRIMLGYLSTTDSDTIIRVMSRDIKEELDDLRKAAFGFEL